MDFLENFLIYATEAIDRENYRVRRPASNPSGVSFGGFFSAERWGTNRFSDGSSAVIVGFGWLGDGNSAVILFAVLSRSVPPPFNGVVSLAPWVGRS